MQSDATHVGSKQMTSLALLALPLEQFLRVIVRPRGVDGRLCLAPYPLSEAIEDWATQHEFAVDQMQARAHTADASVARPYREASRG